MALMTSPARLRWSLLSAAALLLAACGGPAKPADPSTAPRPAADSDAAAPASSATSPGPELAADAKPSDAKPAAATSDAQGEIREEGDDCTPVGAAFEKSVRPALKECYRTGKKSNPNLVGKARLVLAVDATGKVSSVKSDGKSDLGEKVVACMVHALKSAPFDGAAKCKGRTVTIPIEFPTR